MPTVKFYNKQELEASWAAIAKSKKPRSKTLQSEKFDFVTVSREVQARDPFVQEYVLNVYIYKYDDILKAHQELVYNWRCLAKAGRNNADHSKTKRLQEHFAELPANVKSLRNAFTHCNYFYLFL